MKKKIEKTPIFLLGAGRSGTKFLRDILDASDDIAVIPYDVGYVWRYGNENLNHDQLTPDMLNKRIIKYINKTLPKLIKKYPKKKDAKIFIEKSVPNTLRPAFLNKIYPHAKFIHLIRDGRAVTESAMRLWETPPERKYLLNKIKYFPIENYKYALTYLYDLLKNKISPNNNLKTWGPRYIGIQEDLKNLPLEIVCSRQWKNCVETSLSQLKDFNNEKVLEIRYETLMLDSTTIETICEFLGISDSDKVKLNYESRVNRSHTEKWRTLLNNKQLKYINSEISELNGKLGYK